MSGIYGIFKDTQNGTYVMSYSDKHGDQKHLKFSDWSKRHEYKRMIEKEIEDAGEPEQRFVSIELDGSTSKIDDCVGQGFAERLFKNTPFK